jgi:hypothetical protein
MRIWVDVGTGDPFHEADSGVRPIACGTPGRVTFHAWPGGDNSGYWNAHLGQYFAFYDRAFSTCRIKGSAADR